MKAVVQEEMRVARALPIDVELDQILEPPLLAALTALDGRAPLLAGMIRYHLGYADLALQPIDPRSIDRGKRIRPAVTLLAAGAAGGNPAQAAPAAAALELLHNFTLIHDDIQDESPTRRHRPTVWHAWDIKQAINAGDALFATAHLPLFRLVEHGVAPDMVLRIVEAFDRMTIAIVEGQTLDLGFESRSDVTPHDYLTMISGKTAAIIRFAAWAGAIIGGASERAAQRWAECGLALGIGFQIHDDLLGIWGAQAETGKGQGDDIRRRKQSLPILLLRERLDASEQDEVSRLYAHAEIDSGGVAAVLALLSKYSVRDDVERQVAAYHDQALTALRDAAPSPTNPYRQRLEDLVERLASRTG